MPVADDGKKFPYTDKGREAKREYEEMKRMGGTSQGGEQMQTYHGGGILNRSSGPPYKEAIKHSRGGGAARKDSTRFVVVTS